MEHFAIGDFVGYYEQMGQRGWGIVDGISEGGISAYDPIWKQSFTRKPGVGFWRCSDEELAGKPYGDVTLRVWLTARSLR